MRYTFKLLVFGDGGVGKTTLVNRYVSGTFHDDTRITIGVQFLVKRMLVDGSPVDLQLWDFGGEDRFRFILPAYCLGAHGGIFMYDVTSPRTIHGIGEWMKIIHSQAPTIPVVAGGTKVDLVGQKKVHMPEATEITSNVGISEVFEVSSKTGAHVNDLFESVTRLMIAQTSSPTPLVQRGVRGQG